MNEMQMDILEKIDLEESLNLFKKKQKEGYRICPRCGNVMSEGLEYNALDRRTNDLMICPPCGVEQGIEDMIGKKKELQDFWFYNNEKEWLNK